MDSEKNEEIANGDGEEAEEKVIKILEVKELKKKSEEELERERLADIEKKIVKDVLEKWKPKTKAGRLIREKKIVSIDEVLEKYKILEPEIVDSLISVRSDLLAIGQAKGKFGGGKRRVWRQTQKKTAEGNVPTFACMAVVGDENGHVGLGYGKAKETLPAKTKAVRDAKLRITRIIRGCGSFDCSCKEEHSIPFRVEGKCGSSRIILIPAPQGTGLAVGDECKKILRLAGIKDIYGKTFGQTRTTINLAKACMEALKKTKEIKEIK
jgi:small subunit ribosomal protein S5